MDKALLRELRAHCGDVPLLTIGTGITSSHLGDERNLREFILASETAEWLRAEGQNVLLLLIDDCLDPLNFRQLRVGVQKDAALMEAFEPYCGKPICDIPDPYGCHSSYALHFQSAFLRRLRQLEIFPSLINSALSYRRGLYTPYIRIVLEQQEEIHAFLRAEFGGYSLSHLFRVVCPGCGYMDATEIQASSLQEIAFQCARCGLQESRSPDQLRLKLNWKLDCAARWNIYRIDAEPFSKAYLDPRVGSYYVAAALSREFFGGKVAYPIHYGHVLMDRALSYRLLEMLPAGLFRRLFTQNRTTDIQINRENVIAAAQQYMMPEGVSYYDFVRQLLPLRCLENPVERTPEETRLVAQATCFSREILGTMPRLPLPTLEILWEIEPSVREQCWRLLGMAVGMRSKGECGYEAFKHHLIQQVNALGEQRQAVTGGIRRLLGQEQGLPLSRLLYTAPLDFLHLLHSMLHLDVERTKFPTHALTLKTLAAAN